MLPSVVSPVRRAPIGLIESVNEVRSTTKVLREECKGRRLNPRPWDVHQVPVGQDAATCECGTATEYDKMGSHLDAVVAIQGNG